MQKLWGMENNLMKKKALIFISTFFVLAVSCWSEATDRLTIVTAIEPPFQIEEKGQELTGVSVEIMKLILAEFGEGMGTIKVYPWARAYRMATGEIEAKNVLIFSIFRSPERETLFKWGGSLLRVESYFYALKTRTDIVVKTLDDARKYQIGVARDDIQMHYLQARGFNDKNLQVVVDGGQNIMKVLDQRIDLLPSDAMVLFSRCQQMKLACSDLLTPIYKLEESEGDVYFAFSRDTDDNIVNQFKTTLDKIKQQDAYHLILKKYGIIY